MPSSTVDKPSEYNPFTAGGDEAIIETYRWLRDEQPVYHSERYGLYAVSRYEDVRQVSRDWETFTNAKGVDVDHTALLGGPNFVEMDPPEHDWWRRFFQPRFSAKAIREDLLPIIDAEVDRLLDEAVARTGTTIDLGVDFAWKLPIAVTGHLLGIPKEDHPLIARYMREFQERAPGDVTPPPHTVKAAEDTLAYFDQMIEDRRTNLGDDLVSMMLRAEGDGEQISDRELVGMAFFFLDAGTHTTSSLISQAVVLLDRERDQRQLLIDEPERRSEAVEEVLRFEAPLRFLRRVTTKEWTAHGVTVPPDSPMALLYGAANRDERRWDDPDRFDVTRGVQRHMAFGDGIHHCMGAPIARLEALSSLNAILGSFPDYELIDDPIRISSHMMNGYISVPVRLK